MRENRLSGSEGGGATSSPYPYQGVYLLLGDEAAHAGCVRSQEVRAIPGSAGGPREGRAGGGH